MRTSDVLHMLRVPAVGVTLVLCGVTAAVAQVGVTVAGVSGAVVQAQTAAEAANALATMFGGLSVGLSSDELLATLEGAAEAGEPSALWQLGTMYETGEGVKKDTARAFGYFSRITTEYAYAPPRSVEADIVAQSFVKLGDYYQTGLPDAGVRADSQHSTSLLLHAATYFGDADAQFRVGQLYLSDDSALGGSLLQGARWLRLAAAKGHVLAQAALGDLLFQGQQGLETQRDEGLAWLNIAYRRATGTAEEAQVTELLNRAMSIATPDQRAAALAAAEDFTLHFIE